ncbi:FAD/NAD(P)-binding protein [Leisingera sp. NJS201]|uniref:FAD/NAD(P)-binding protein n=1 Tax=Leisingera sp. NJS201 TaxID=2508306 RepID=UPI00142F6A04|nr:FAD/NAD(P)-binding protein [Leisingera sp. NJS201]
MKIAVLGAGYAGVSVLENLVSTLPDLSALSVDVFDKSRSFGPGVAYQEDSETNLLNRPLKLMYLSRRNDFRDWLVQFGARDAAADEDGFLQRAQFGRFLQSRFDDLCGAVRAAGGRIRIIGAEVEAIAPVAAPTHFISCPGRAAGPTMTWSICAWAPIWKRTPTG